MGRQFVHLSVDVPTAVTVGRRKSTTPVLLRVHAGAAYDGRVPFWRGNEKVWLTDHIPADYLSPEQVPLP
jgi:putative RNA 2'-phosphotransferase